MAVKMSGGSQNDIRDKPKFWLCYSILYGINCVMVIMVILIASIDKQTLSWESLYAKSWSKFSKASTNSTESQKFCTSTTIPVYNTTSATATKSSTPIYSTASSAIASAGTANGTFLHDIGEGDLQQDDPMCLSRTQQLRLRDPSRLLQVPPELQKEWKRYVDLHKRCSEGKNWTQLFTEDALLHTSMPGNGKDGCKYVLYLDGTEGLGNRLLSLASAWAYALTTDRVLLIDTRRRLDLLLCEPFPGSSWLLPNDFPYKELEDKSPKLGPLVQNNYTSRVVNLYLGYLQSPEDSQFFCEDIYQSLKQVTWVAWRCNLYSVPNHFLIPSFWQKMRLVFPSPDHSFALISRLLLNPSNEIWGMVLQEYRSYLASARRKVGVQVRLLRYRWDPAVYNPMANEMIMECLVRYDYLPRVENASSASSSASLSSAGLIGLSAAGTRIDTATVNTTTSAGDVVHAAGRTASARRRDDSDSSSVSTVDSSSAGDSELTWGQAAIQSFERLRQGDTLADVAVLVASLQGEYYRQMKRLYAGHVTGGAQAVRVHNVCELSREDKSLVQAQLALLEMILLSLCDQLATSGSSTFGYMAQSWGNTWPLILDFGQINKEVPGDICTRVGHSIDPCLHTPRKPRCLESPAIHTLISSDHKKWLDDHLHYCQDRPFAWQLVQHNPRPEPVFRFNT